MVAESPLNVLITWVQTFHQSFNRVVIISSRGNGDIPFSLSTICMAPAASKCKEETSASFPIVVWKCAAAFLVSYSQTSSINHTKSENLNVSPLVFQLICAIYWNQVLSLKWSSWSSSDRWCSNYIGVINNFITKGVFYQRVDIICILELGTC